jgi:hypothetical protein
MHSLAGNNNNCEHFPNKTLTAVPNNSGARCTLAHTREEETDMSSRGEVLLKCVQTNNTIIESYAPCILTTFN